MNNKVFSFRKLRDVLQQRVIRFLLDQSKKDAEKYARFFDDYGLFMREGIVTTAEQSVKVRDDSFSLFIQPVFLWLCLNSWFLSSQEDIAKLLRFESSALPAGQQTSLMEYASRMKAGTRNIYYLCAPNRHLAEHSPYFEAMKQKDMEVRLETIRSTVNIHDHTQEQMGWSKGWYNALQICWKQMLIKLQLKCTPFIPILKA